MLAFALRMCVAIGLIALLISRVDRDQFSQTITQFGLEPYLWLIPIAGLGWLVYVWRWRLLLLPLGLKPPFRELVVDSLVGLFYGLFVPTGLAGDAVRAFRLGKRHHAIRKTLLTVVVDRLVSLFAITLLLGIQTIRNGSAWQGIRFSWIGWTILIVLIMTVALIAGGGGWLSQRLPGWARRRGERWGLLGRWPFNRLAHQTSQVWDLVQEYAGARRFVVLSIAASATYQLLVTLIYYVGSAKLGIHVSFGDYVWIVALVTLAQIVPITVAGLGVREGLFAFLLGQHSVPATTSVVLSLAVFGITLLFGILGGVLELTGASTSLSECSSPSSAATTQR